ncbi:putative protein-lysine N-methyltransferase Efm5/EEF1AKMT1 [Helianthus anomalus]
MEGEINHNTIVGANDVNSPALSAHALEALKEFLSEQNRLLATDNDGAMATEEKEAALVTEDWRLSQFWYDCETAETVASEVHALYMWWWWLKVTMEVG